MIEMSRNFIQGLASNVRCRSEYIKGNKIVSLDKDRYYFINEGNAYLIGRNQNGDMLYTVIDNRMIITTIGCTYNCFDYDLSFSSSGVLYSIHRDDLEAYIRTCDDPLMVMNQLMSAIQGLVSNLASHVSLLQISDGDKRLYSYLKATNTEDCFMPLTYHVLGKLVNLNEETCSRKIKKMTKEGTLNEDENYRFKVKQQRKLSKYNIN